MQYGVAQKKKKGEDNYSIEAGNGCHFYGVFDGHGGANVSVEAARDLPGILLELGASPKIDAVIDAYYELDKRLGRRYVNEGSTAVCAVVEQNEPRKASVSLSWCGDSIGIEVCMLSKTLIFQTSIHHVKNIDEVKRVELQGKVREGNLSLDAVSQRDLSDLVRRGLEYEANLIPVDAERGVKRAQTTISPRLLADGSHGPTVVQTNIDTGDNGVFKTVSTQITRAIGDWDSARTITPHPEVLLTSFEIAQDAELDQSFNRTDILSKEKALSAENKKATALPHAVWRRFVLASDGLWDVVDPEKAAKIISRIEDPAQAASALLSAARKRYKAINPHLDQPFKDDTTIVCFDLRLGHIQRRQRTFDVSTYFSNFSDAIWSKSSSSAASNHKKPTSSSSSS